MDLPSIHETSGIVILGVLGLFGNSLASIVGALTTAHFALKAQREAKKAALVSEQTHILVNSQRTVMLRALATLTARIAADNPDDLAAQIAALAAQADLEAAPDGRGTYAAVIKI